MSEAQHIERFSVSAESQNETKTVIEARDFEFAVDEPRELGGNNDAPNPVEYLLGAWAGCLNVVVHTVGDDLGIEIDHVEVELEGDLDPRKFLGVVDDVRAGYQEIRVSIDVEADVTEETLATLSDAVEERCPVGNNIQAPTPTDVNIDVV